MWSLLDFLLKMVRPEDRSPKAAAPSAELCALEQDATRCHVEAMSYLRQGIYEKAEESVSQALNGWKQLRHRGSQGGYGGHLTDRLAAERIKTLNRLYNRCQEYKELSASILSHLDTDNFLEANELRLKISCGAKELAYLLRELEIAGRIESYEAQNGKVLWRKRPNN